MPARSEGDSEGPALLHKHFGVAALHGASLELYSGRLVAGDGDVAELVHEQPAEGDGEVNPALLVLLELRQLRLGNGRQDLHSSRVDRQVVDSDAKLHRGVCRLNLEGHGVAALAHFDCLDFVHVGNRSERVLCDEDDG
eukprot:760162-Hanusia_phi.AAC.2